MPTRPPTPCATPGCAALSHAARCDVHRKARYREQEQHRDHKRGSTRRWRKLRRLVLNRDPICGCGDVTSEADHIKPVSQGGGDEMDNLQGLCARCHADKSARDRLDPFL